jgi:hypothetical protein
VRKTAENCTTATTHLATGSAAEIPHSLHILVFDEVLGQMIPGKFVFKQVADAVSGALLHLSPVKMLMTPPGRSEVSKTWLQTLS